MGFGERSSKSSTTPISALNTPPLPIPIHFNHTNVNINDQQNNMNKSSSLSPSPLIPHYQYNHNQPHAKYTHNIPFTPRGVRANQNISRDSIDSPITPNHNDIHGNEDEEFDFEKLGNQIQSSIQREEAIKKETIPIKKINTNAHLHTHIPVPASLPLPSPATRYPYKLAPHPPPPPPGYYHSQSRRHTPPLPIFKQHMQHIQATTGMKINYCCQSVIPSGDSLDG
eukprot:176630_1